MRKLILIVLAWMFGALGFYASVKAENPYIINNVRFTFVTGGLVRMEYADGGNFVDEKNRFFINQNALSSNVKVEQKGERSIITAPKMRLEYVVQVKAKSLDKEIVVSCK